MGGGGRLGGRGEGKIKVCNLYTITEVFDDRIAGLTLFAKQGHIYVPNVSVVLVN